MPFQQIWQWERPMPEALAGLGQEKLLLLDFSLALAPGEEGGAGDSLPDSGGHGTGRGVPLPDHGNPLHRPVSPLPRPVLGDFRDLEVELRLSGAAPLLTESSLNFRPAGWRRYIYRSSVLPEGELSFTAAWTWWVPVVRIILPIGLAVGLALFL